MSTIKVLFVILILFIAIQFVPGMHNQSGQTGKNNLNKMVQVPEDIDAIFKKSCYDCHSNNTNYPWYAKIQPVRFWLDHHIKEGKEELNFDEFGSYPLRKQLRKLKEVVSTVDEGEMPLSSYTLIHRDAKLSQAQKNKIRQWAEGAKESLQKGI